MKKLWYRLTTSNSLPAMALACISVFSTESDLCVNFENMNNGNNILNKTILSEKKIEIFSKNHLFNLHFSKNILIYLVVS